MLFLTGNCMKRKLSYVWELEMVHDKIRLFFRFDYQKFSFLVLYTIIIRLRRKIKSYSFGYKKNNYNTTTGDHVLRFV